MELTRAERAARDLRHHEIIADEYERVVNEPRTLGMMRCFARFLACCPNNAVKCWVSAAAPGK